MRRSRDAQFVYDDKKNFIGICLGADYCAEHEWGIKELRNAFKLDDTKLGIDARRINEVPEFTTTTWCKRGLTKFSMMYKKTQYYFIIFFDYYPKDKEIKTTDDLPRELYLTNELSCAWDSKSFGICSTKASEMEALWTALQAKDIAIGLGKMIPDNPFENAGLRLMIISKLPKEALKAMYDSDEDNKWLEECAKLTGIHDYLKKAGKQYFALSPRWVNDKKTEVRFWLNPQDQQNNNFGWFNIEELQQWADDKGPIPKGKK